MGVNGVGEIKVHPFFIGIDWKRLREKKAPNIPEVLLKILDKKWNRYLKFWQVWIRRRKKVLREKI